MNLTLPMRAKNLADSEGLAQSRRQHELMIELLKGRDSWALAQLCVDHMRVQQGGLSRPHRQRQKAAIARDTPRLLVKEARRCVTWLC